MGVPQNPPLPRLAFRVVLAYARFSIWLVGVDLKKRKNCHPEWPSRNDCMQRLRRRHWVLANMDYKRYSRAYSGNEAVFSMQCELIAAQQPNDNILYHYATQLFPGGISSATIFWGKAESGGHILPGCLFFPHGTSPHWLELRLC